MNQTYKDLEILLVDDGSIDRSGVICDEYAEKDERIRVFHTENRGLSCARNVGLDEAHGEWIGFVDSDDWIEANMYEVLLSKAKETGADIVECGIYEEYADRTIKKNLVSRTYREIDAVEAMIAEQIKTQVWNKIWNKVLFRNVRFPNGHDFEDVATTYKLIRCAKISNTEYHAYHYRKRNSSISQNHHTKNLVDNWIAHKQRYEDLKEIVGKETVNRLLMFCAYAIARTWAWYLKCERDSVYISEMVSFVHNNYPVFGEKEWPLQLRISIFLSRFNNWCSFLIAYYFNQIYRSFKSKHYA